MKSRAPPSHLLHGSVDHMNEKESDGLVIDVLDLSIVQVNVVPYSFSALMCVCVCVCVYVCVCGEGSVARQV